MAFIRCEGIGSNSTTIDGIEMGTAISPSFASAFIDTKGRFRYVGRCAHWRAADIIMKDDNIARPQCVCDTTSEHFNEWGCDCSHDNLDADGILQSKGYIHLSCVGTYTGYEFNLYGDKRPNQSQMDTLFDFYLTLPDTNKFTAGLVIDTFMAEFGLDPMINVKP